MEIRKTKRTMVVDDYVYVAEDGKEFKTSRECEEYEYNLKHSQAIDRLEGIVHFHDDPPDGDIDCVYKWYYLRSQQDLDDLRFCEYYDKDADAYEFCAESFPCWVRLLITNYGCGSIITLEQHKKEVLSYIEDLDNTIAAIEEMIMKGQRET